jgi:hypothetical protein
MAAPDELESMDVVTEFNEVLESGELDVPELDVPELDVPELDVAPESDGVDAAEASPDGEETS